jgi:large subunit ribosomal protein L29
MSTKELRTKSAEELVKDVDELEEELYKLRFRKVTDVENDPSKYKKIKKQIARIKTILREREIEAAKAGAASAAAE